MNIEVLTYANKSNFYFPYLIKSSERYQYPLKILGWNDKWNGYGNKLIACYNYLKNIATDKQSGYALIIDAWDVIFIRPFEEFSKEMTYNNYDIIFSSTAISEENMPDKYVQRYLINYGNKITFDSKNINNLLNAGIVYIKIQTFIEIFEKYKPDEYTDDQILYIKIIEENVSNYKYIIDHNNFYFLTQIPGNAKCQIERIENHLINPFIVHAPGSSSMDLFIKKYFNSISESELLEMQPDKFTETRKKIPYYFSHVMKNKCFEILLLIIVILLNFKNVVKILFNLLN